MQTLTADEMNLAARVARRVSRHWRGVEEDDILSTLYLWLVENMPVVHKYRSEPGGAGKLYVALRREGNKFAAAEQKVRVGRGLRDDNFYTAEKVSLILPFLFEDVPQTVAFENPVTGAAVASSLPEDHNVAAAILADVSGAFYGLPKETQEVLFWRYREGLTLQEISDLAGITPMGAKKRVDRAVQRIVDALAGDRL